MIPTVPCCPGILGTFVCLRSDSKWFVVGKSSGPRLWVSSVSCVARQIQLWLSKGIHVFFMAKYRGDLSHQPFSSSVCNSCCGVRDFRSPNMLGRFLFALLGACPASKFIAKQAQLAWGSPFAACLKGISLDRLDFGEVNGYQLERFLADGIWSEGPYGLEMWPSFSIFRRKL